MAGAYLTIGAKFRPFSYDEIIKPLADSTAMHLKIDEQYGELQQKANVWENLANKETDQKSYQKYKEYADALRAQAEDLAKNGLNPQSFRSLMDMKARYSSDIVPIEQAYTRRRQLADEQRKMQLQNPTLKFQRDMSTTSLDDFVDNPELDYGYSVNGALVAQQAGQAFAHLAKAIQTDPKYEPILNGYYYQSKVKAGYSPIEILKLASDDPNAPKELKAISQQVYDSTGVEEFIHSNYNDPTSAEAQEWRDYVNSYINQGAWNAVGTTQYGTMANPQKAYENQLELAKIKASKSGKAGSASGVARKDEALFGTKGKKNGNEEHFLGARKVRGAEDSQMILNLIASAYPKSKKVPVVTGYDENGDIATQEKSYSKVIDEKNVDVIGLQIDYTTGNLYASIKTKGTNDIENILIPYKNVFDIKSQDKITQYLQLLAANDIALKAKRIDKDYAAKYKEGIMDNMYTLLSSLFEYTGGLNTNTDAGEKRAVADDAETSVLDVFTEIE